MVHFYSFFLPGIALVTAVLLYCFHCLSRKGILRQSFSAQSLVSPPSSSSDRSAWQSLAMALVQQSDTVLELSLKQSALLPRDVSFGLFCVDQLKASGQFKQAQSICRRLLVCPDLSKQERVNIIESLVLLYLKEGQFDRSQRLFEKELFSSTLSASFVLAWLKLQVSEGRWRLVYTFLYENKVWRRAYLILYLHACCVCWDSFEGREHRSLRRFWKASAINHPRVFILLAKDALSRKEFSLARSYYNQIESSHWSFLPEIYDDLCLCAYGVKEGDVWLVALFRKVFESTASQWALKYLLEGITRRLGREKADAFAKHTLKQAKSMVVVTEVLLWLSGSPQGLTEREQILLDLLHERGLGLKASFCCGSCGQAYQVIPWTCSVCGDWGYGSAII